MSRSLFILLFLAGCASETDGPPCGPPGLYTDSACGVVSSDLIPFTPQYALWTDGAVKERWIYLPPGTTIDAGDPNAWVFPVGTRAYKSFTRDGVRVETRMLEKTAEGTGLAAWTMRVFLWSPEQDGVVEDFDGEIDALGTMHDVPAPGMCATCHARAGDVILGFSAIQLAHAGAETTLDALIAGGRLSNAPPALAADATVPGDDTARAALGYLHANCGHCHAGPAAPEGLRMRLDVGLATPEETATYTTAVGVPASWMSMPRIAPGDPANSAIWVRNGMRGLDQMPPLGTEIVDSAGHDAVGAWISALARTL
jgi:hypothetical protein